MSENKKELLSIDNIRKFLSANGHHAINQLMKTNLTECISELQVLDSSIQADGEFPDSKETTIWQDVFIMNSLAMITAESKKKKS